MTVEEIREHIATVAHRLGTHGLYAHQPSPKEQAALYLAVDLLLNGPPEARS